ncbi:unnamed protein product [Sphagnum jensenii]|uniref:Uncharacterized protein n=1 Tax=Sphagnum jensenii TaxID=128206 RepID=A0ABP1B2V5_9BRYO
MRETTLVSGSSKNLILPRHLLSRSKITDVAFAHPLLTAWADGCIVSISSAARAVAVWPGIVYAGVKGMFWLMIHLLPLVIHQS